MAIAYNITYRSQNIYITHIKESPALTDVQDIWYLISGGTIVAAIRLIKERGVDNKQIKVVKLSQFVLLFIYLFLVINKLLNLIGLYNLKRS